MMKKINILISIILVIASLNASLVFAQSERIQGRFEWSKGDVIPTAGKVEYEVTFIPDDIQNYDTATTTIELDIAKAVPKSESDGEWNSENVTAIAFAKSGDMFKDIEISDYNIYDVNNNILPGTWRWNNEDEKVSISGEYDIIFIPDDSVNYEELQTKVYITVQKSGSGSSNSVKYNVVTYDAGEFGKISEGYSKTEKVRHGETVKNIPQITADDGYKHIGWEANGETIDLSSFEVNEKVIFKAVYVKVNMIKYLQGYNGYVYPDSSITRAEAATIFARISGYAKENNTAGISRFTDVNNSDWYAGAVKFTADKGIITGYEDGTFRPEANITRAELSVMIYRYLGLTATAKSHFEDVTSHWAERYIATLENLNFINGYEDKTFRPDNYITRAETVKCVNRMLGIDGSTYETEKPDFADIDKTHWAFEDIAAVAY